MPAAPFTPISPLAFTLQLFGGHCEGRLPPPPHPHPGCVVASSQGTFSSVFAFSSMLSPPPSKVNNKAEICFVFDTENQRLKLTPSEPQERLGAETREVGCPLPQTRPCRVGLSCSPEPSRGGCIAPYCSAEARFGSYFMVKSPKFLQEKCSNISDSRTASCLAQSSQLSPSLIAGLNNPAV